MGISPLVSGYGAGATFAWREGRPIPVEQFLGDATALAASLPDRRYLLNLCTDRYHFAVGFAAALLRGQVNLQCANGTVGAFFTLAPTAPATLQHLEFRKLTSDTERIGAPTGAPAGVSCIAR